MTSIDKVSFLDPAVLRCPFAAYDTVRRAGPVYFDESLGQYIVTGYDEVRRWAANTGDLSNVTGLLLSFDAMPWQARINAIYETRGFLPMNTLTVSDPPLHSFHRSLVDKAFTASRVRQMEDYLRGTIDTMIDRFIARGHCEFYSEFAAMVPIHVIASQVGVELADIDWFKACSSAVIAESNPTNSEEEQVAITLKITELQQFIADRIRAFERQPGDCLLSDLVHADDNGRRMEMRELVSLVLILLVAGNDSTALALSSAMHRLITGGFEPELREDPARIPAFVEEVLRLEAPVQGLYRRALNDIVIGDTAIPKGRSWCCGSARPIEIRRNSRHPARSIRRAATAANILPSAPARISASATSWRAVNCASLLTRCCAGWAISVWLTAPSRPTGWSISWSMDRTASRSRSIAGDRLTSGIFFAGDLLRFEAVLRSERLTLCDSGYILNRDEAFAMSNSSTGARNTGDRR